MSDVHASRPGRGFRADDPRRVRGAPPREDASPSAGARGGEALPHCIDCGCCCFSADPEYIRVFGIDLDRMDVRARSFTVERAGRVTMRMAEGRCAALVVDPQARTFTCDVYEARPDVCRSLTRGSGGCLGDRRDKVDAPLLAIASLVAPRR
jgi:hypothetical protein